MHARWLVIFNHLGTKRHQCARVEIPATTPNVGWVCWVSPFLREVSRGILREKLLLERTDTFKRVLKILLSASRVNKFQFYYNFYNLQSQHTISSVADLLGPTTAVVLSALDWEAVLRIPGTQDINPPLEVEETGFLSTGAMGAKDVLASLSGRWVGLESGVEVWDRIPWNKLIYY